MKQVFLFNSEDAPSTVATEYNTISGSSFTSGTWNATEAVREGLIADPAGVTISNWKIALATAPGAGNSWTFTVRKNGADTGVTVTISGTDLLGEDLTNSASFSAGDRISVSSTPASGPTAPNIIKWSIDCVGGTAKYSIYPTHTFTVFGTAGTREYTSLTSVATIATAIGILHTLPVPIEGTIKTLYVLLSAAPGGVGKSYLYSIYKNGVEEASSIITITNAATTGSVTGLSIDITKDDTLVLSVISSGTPTASQAALGMAIEADTDGESMISGHTNDDLENNLTEYNRLVAGTNSAWDGTETNVQMKSGVTSWTFSNFRFHLQTAPGAGNSFDFTLRKDAADTASTFEIAGTNTTGSDDTNTVAIVDGSLLAYKHVGTSLPAVGDSCWAAVMYIAPVGGSTTWPGYIGSGGYF